MLRALYHLSLSLFYLQQFSVTKSFSMLKVIDLPTALIPNLFQFARIQVSPQGRLCSMSVWTETGLLAVILLKPDICLSGDSLDVDTNVELHLK